MYVRAYSSSRRMNAIIHQLYRLSFICPKSSIPRFFFFLSPSCGCLLVKWRFHHLTGTLYSVWPKPLTAHCDDRWQRGPLCSSDHPKPRTTECHLKQASAAECDTAWLSSCFRQAVSGCARQGSCWSNRDGHSTRCCPASRTNTHNLVHARNRRQALWFPPLGNEPPSSFV